MRNHHYLLLMIAILLPLAAFVAGAGTVFAQSSCGLQASSASATTQYPGTNYGTYSQWSIQLTVPVSTTCPTVNGQIWVVGNVFDTYANTNIGSASTAMAQTNGYYSGQLVFTLPPSAVNHSLQLQLFAYGSYVNGQFATLLGSTTQTVTVNGNSYVYSPPTAYTGYYNSSPEYCSYQNGYMYCYYPTSGYYYYYSSPYYYTSSCANGQAMIYYNGSYYAVDCHHP